MSTTAETRIKVFTLNCWGLKYISKRRPERIRAISRFLESSDFDIVALQELWVYADYEIIRSRLSRSLPFSKFFYSGALGAGLVIFSRFPIVAATIHPYSLNGSPLGGDWIVGKAAASVVIRHPTLGQVQVFNTHLYAKGGESGAEHHQGHRLVNAWELAKLAKQAAELGRYVIAAGDFNTIPTSLPMTVIRDHASLTDAWEATHLAPSPSIASTSSLSPTQAVEIYGVTADSPLNTYSAGKTLEACARTFRGKRLDYIFFRDPSPIPAPAAAARAPMLVAADTHVLLTDTVPGLPYSYSDHFGVSATLRIEYPRDEGADHATTTPGDDLVTAAQRQTQLAISTTSFTPPDPARDSAKLSAVDVTAVLGTLAACSRHAHTRARRHLLIFGFSVGTLVALVAAADRFSAKATSFVVLGSAVATWLGTTMFYVGFVFGRWEVNALQNVIEELELYRRDVEDFPTAGE